jgi:hypothetical protein
MRIRRAEIANGICSPPTAFLHLLLSAFIRVHPWFQILFRGFYRTNVSCAGPVPVAACRNAIVSPA